MKEDTEEIFETLDEAHERLRELKKERNKLLKANKKLARTLVSLEKDLEDAGAEIDSLNEHSYSFHEGWNSHKDEIVLEEISEDSVDSQLRVLDKLLADKDIISQQ